MSTRKRTLLGVGLVAVAGVTAAAIRLKDRGQEAIPVETAVVEPMTIVETVTATGRIQPKTQVQISADVSGKITRLGVEEGDWVEKGQFLIELDRERYQAAVEVAEASLRAAESNAELARENMVKADKDYQRARSLFESNLESPAQIDAAYASAQAEKARHRSALDQVEQARAARKQAEDDLSKTRIYAPLSGTVSKLDKEVGEIALGSQFQEDVILEVANLSGMEAVVDVDENDIVRVARANRASIEVDALPDVTLGGEVTDIANAAKVGGQGTTEQKTEFEVKVAVTEANPTLRPGMTATAEITTETKQDVLGVPIQSVAVRTPEQVRTGAVAGADPSATFTPDKDGFVELVFVVADGHVRARQVKTGIQSDTHIEVLAGLDAGDEVVTGNYRAISKDLQHGSAVLVKKSPPRAEAVASHR